MKYCSGDSKIPFRFYIFMAIVVFILPGCGEPVELQPEAVRGLRIYQVENSTKSVERRYASVIQPHDETHLAFELSGQLLEMELDEGQFVQAGAVLLALDPSTYKLRTLEAEANVSQASSAHRYANANFVRQAELWGKRLISRAAYDDAQTSLDAAQAQLEQSQKRLGIAREELAKTKLRAPFDGIIASIEASSFETVSSGQDIVTLYSESNFEAAFSVPSSVLEALGIGHVLQVRVSDLAGALLTGHISELGNRASEVSVFPVVALIDEPPENLKSGMSAEVVLEVPLAQAAGGLLIPITCFAFNTVTQLREDGAGIPVFVYDEASGTVRQRTVDVVGVRGNMVIIRRGLVPGEIVAAAGVSYLRDGLPVKLLEGH